MATTSEPQQQQPEGFLSDREWNTGSYDYVIVGSSFCAYAFTNQTLKANPNANILILERGEYKSPDYFEQRSPKELGKEEKETEDRPWEFSPTNCSIKDVRGMNYQFGGRSCFWKAWCPEPTEEEMTEWPSLTVSKVKEYFPKAKELLSVRNTDSIGCTPGESPFNHKILDLTHCSEIESITKVQPAPIAIVEKPTRYGSHQKYSVLEPLLKIMHEHSSVKAVTGCLVKKILHENGKATALETDKGELALGDAKLILAMSTLPSTTLMLNSFPHLPNIGCRFTAHFASYTYARFPCEGTSYPQATNMPDMAAAYMTGENKESRHRFHLQVNAVAVRGGEKPDFDIMRNLLKTPKKEMLDSCSNHMVLVCASIGQVDHKNTRNRFCRNGDMDITRNAILHFTMNNKDKELWDTMDKATFKVLETLAQNKNIEYWNPDSKKWQKDRPEKLIRHKSLVHPASTMWIGDDDQSAPVDLDYKFHGVENVYLTGGALWPTGGSWNPTCTMTAMAMDLADRLNHQVVESKL